jgi:dGTP triphosphohydrolase
MPANYREQSAGEPPQRQVCDYIAGMTDGFFLKTCDALGLP